MTHQPLNARSVFLKDKQLHAVLFFVSQGSMVSMSQHTGIQSPDMLCLLLVLVQFAFATKFTPL